MIEFAFRDEKMEENCPKVVVLSEHWQKDIERLGKEHKKRHPTLKKGAYVGSGAKCLGNITLGTYSRVGANAVVLQDVPDYATAVGMPARIIERKREDVEISL